MASYHLCDFFECAILDLWEEEVHPDGRNRTGWEPDEAVSGAPVERVRVDKIRRSELRQPGAGKSNGGSKAKSVAPQSLGRDFTS